MVDEKPYSLFNSKLQEYLLYTLYGFQVPLLKVQDVKNTV